MKIQIWFNKTHLHDSSSPPWLVSIDEETHFADRVDIKVPCWTEESNGRFYIACTADVAGYTGGGVITVQNFKQ